MSLPTNTWIKIEDSLPPKSELYTDFSIDVILSNNEEWVLGYYFFSLEKYYQVDEGIFIPTHFMIIELPK